MKTGSCLRPITAAGREVEELVKELAVRYGRR